MTTGDSIAAVGLGVLLASNLVAVGAMWGSLRAEVRSVKDAISREGDDGLVGRRELVTALDDNRRVHSELKADAKGLAGVVGYHTERIGAIDATIEARRET